MFALISIRPQYVDAILGGTKWFELRRRRPRLPLGSTLFLYSSSPDMKVRGVAAVGRVITQPLQVLWEQVRTGSAVDETTFFNYFDGCEVGHALELHAARPLAQEVSLRVLRWRMPDYLPPQFYHRINVGHPLYSYLYGTLTLARVDDQNHWYLRPRDLLSAARI